MASQFQLIMRSGPTPGAAFALEGDQIDIGRDSTNEIVINDAEISRRHARLQRLPHGWLLIDLGSTNGTWVNSERVVVPLLLQDDDLVLLGEQRLIFRLASCATRSAPGRRQPRAETELDR